MNVEVDDLQQVLDLLNEAVKERALGNDWKAARLESRARALLTTLIRALP